MNWHKALIKELASRRCIIFLGSGASASCLSVDGTKRPPTWNEFLQGLLSIMNNHDDDALIADLIHKEKFLDAAEIIKKNISLANYTDFLRNTLQVPNFKPSKIHEAVFKIDPKVVITTNYDEIYDNYCRQGQSSNGYNISTYYDEHLVSDLRSPIRCIVKAHGSITDTSKTILTRSEYFSAKSKFSNFHKVLDSLFVTNTILFVGYSISDPDIQLILENANIASIGAHPHYACLENNIHPSIKEALNRTYNIEFIDFQSGNFLELEAGLEELANEVESYRQSNPI